MISQAPPKLPRKIFEWHCGSAKVDDLLGDAEEWYTLNRQTKSAFLSNLIYYKQIFSLMFSYSVRKRKADATSGLYSVSPFNPTMLKNYFKVSVRNLSKHKAFSLINIFGLAMGMSIGLFLIALLTFAYSYDNFHPQHENIYRIISTWTDGAEKVDFAPAPAALVHKLTHEYSLPIEYARINRGFNAEVIIGKQNLTISGHYTDPAFLRIFHFPLTRGDARTALQKPNSVVLTQKAALKFFGTADPLGKTLLLKDLGEYEITGVFKDLPKNTHFKFEALASYASLPLHLQPIGSKPIDWLDYAGQNITHAQYVYLKVSDAKAVAGLTEALKKIETEVYPASNPVKATFALQALNDINPGPDLRMNLGVVWDYIGLLSFIIVAILILLPACFNYTNLSIARAIKRAKEIGMRKTLGSQNGHIFTQFITETVVITSLALIMGIGLFLAFRGQFLGMLAESTGLDLRLSPTMIAAFVAFALATGFISGIAPALFFSRLNPIQALKNKMASGTLSGQKVRKALTVFQFAASFTFILLIVVFARQYRYTINYNFGFQKENILDIELRDANPENFRAEFSRLSTVQGMSMSSGVPGLSFSNTYITEPGKADSLEVFQMFVDHHYIPNLKIQLLAGENFKAEAQQSETSIIVNEEFIRSRNIGNPIDALGKEFVVDGNLLTIVGVVKDFNYGSLRESIKSFFFRNNPKYFTHANVKVAFADAYSGLSEMEGLWKSLTGANTFSAKFLDDEIADSFDFYVNLLKMLGYLGALALTISIMGMLGMVVYTAETRTKEVGIRKVMGATAWNLTFLLSRDFIKLIVLGVVLVSPLAVFALDWFISEIQFYSIRLSIWDILAAFTILLSIGFVAIASQTMKTARTNPVDTLRVE